MTGQNEATWPPLNDAAEIRITKRLKAFYDDVVEEPVPDRLLQLLDELDKTDRRERRKSRQ